MAANAKRKKAWAAVADRMRLLEDRVQQLEDQAHGQAAAPAKKASHRARNDG